jgi:hypothetical protein
VRVPVIQSKRGGGRGGVKCEQHASQYTKGRATLWYTNKPTAKAGVMAQRREENAKQAKQKLPRLGRMHRRK